MKAILKLALFALVGSAKANELHGSEGSTDSKMTVIKEKNRNEMLNGAWSLNKALLEPDASPDEMDIDLEEGGCFWTGCKKGGCPRGYTEITRSGFCWRYRTEYCCKSPTPKPTKPPQPPKRTKEECIEQRCRRRKKLIEEGCIYEQECIERECGCSSCTSDDLYCNECKEECKEELPRMLKSCIASCERSPNNDVFTSEDGDVVISGNGDVAGKKLVTGDGDTGLQTLAPRRSLRKVQI